MTTGRSQGSFNSFFHFGGKRTKAALIVPQVIEISTALHSKGEMEE
jgi:hypothetical protein